MLKNVLRTAAAFAVVLASGAAFAGATLSINTALTSTDPLYKGLERFRDKVTKPSNGKIEVKLFPDSQLGSDEDVLEQAAPARPLPSWSTAAASAQLRQGVRRARRALSGDGLRRASARW